MVHGNYYGTSIAQVLNVRDNLNKICLLDIDVQGAKDIYASKLIDCNYLFLTVPSIDDLERRLRLRKTETEETLKRRLGNAESEIKSAQEWGKFQKWIVND